jgi:hypothetical protein
MTNQSIEDASQFDHVDMVNAIHKATGCNRPLSSDYFTGDINLTVFLEEMFKAQAARQSSQSEPVGWIDVQESGMFDTVYSCPKCDKRYSVQAEDTFKSMTCSCGFSGSIVYAAPQQAIQAAAPIDNVAGNFDYIISYLEECVAEGQVNLLGLLKDVNNFRALIQKVNNGYS